MGGTLKVNGIEKGSGQEAGRSKAGVVFWSPEPTLQEPGEDLGKGRWGPGEGGGEDRSSLASVPSFSAPGHQPW